MQYSPVVLSQEPQRWERSHEMRGRCSSWADGAGRQTSVIGDECVPVVRALSAGTVSPRRRATCVSRRHSAGSQLPGQLPVLAGVKRHMGKAPTKTPRTGK